MNWRNPRLWIGVLAAAGVAMMAISDLGRSAPGPVATVHAQVDRLRGGQACRQCHGGLFSTMTSSCLACHEPIATQLDAGTGVHGRLGKERASQCALCHSEHHGNDFALVNSVSFAQAGVGDVATFDHALIGFTMRGRHLEADCEQCHLLARAAVLRPGERRFLGLTQACASCHMDAHGGRMQAACTSCHGQTSFQTLEAEGHAAHLPLVGGHAAASCRSCHAENDAHSLEALGEGRAPPPRTCADCHASPHQARFVTAAATPGDDPPAPSPASADTCATCHAVDHTSFHAAAKELTAREHAHTGFALVPPHDRAACTQCHGEAAPDDTTAGATFAARFPARHADDCRACHEDPHGGQFDDSALATTGCLSCHGRTHFAPHTFGLEQHAAAALPLEGRHAEAKCEACHVQPNGSTPRVFVGTNTQCDGCHADAHDDYFAPVLARHPPVAHGDCARCHVATAFADPPPTRFDHAAWTGFDLAASHAQAQCEACHRPAAAPDAHGRRFGRVATTFAPKAGCVRCHADPHAGAFDGRGLPAEVEGRGDCARCHGEASFRALPDHFDHGRWTGFALDGSHRELACTLCHAPLRQATADGRTLARARGTTCAACHDDPHGGQFVIDRSTDCARCHRATHFKSIVFNHNLDARFPLGDAHAGVACSACHKGERIGDRDAVRYRPLPRTCVECHGAHEEQLRRRKRKGS